MASSALPRGFTMIELLVVIAVISILIAILVPVLGKARECAVITGELSAARQFIAAHQMYSSDFDSRVMPGFPSQGMINRNEVIVRNDRGQRLTDITARRYPWRILPYLEYNREILFRNRAAMETLFDSTPRDYAESEAPRMGMNVNFVGGSSDFYALVDSQAIRDRAIRSWGRLWYISRASDATRPEQLIVFATSQQIHTDLGRIEGMHRVTPPITTTRQWQLNKPTESDDPRTYGNLNFSWSGRTVTSMLDGHAETLDWSEAQDMRHWSPRADAPDWKLPPL